MRPYYIPQEFSFVLVTIVYVSPDVILWGWLGLKHQLTKCCLCATKCQHKGCSKCDQLPPHARHWNFCPWCIKNPHQWFQSLFTQNHNHKLFSTYEVSYTERLYTDQCYTNVQDAYTSVPLPPLGQSDHNLLQLIPKCMPLVQRKPNVTCTIIVCWCRSEPQVISKLHWLGCFCWLS